MSLDPNSAAKLDTLKQILNKHKHSALMTVVRLASLVAFAYVLGYGILMLGYLFPRIVFEIGEGIKRHEQVIWLRRFVMGSIVICGVLIPLIRGAIIR
jgi:hypothetical protein